jgi:glutamate-ammonia-ligase adenylyltransferase
MTSVERTTPSGIPAAGKSLAERIATGPRLTNPHAASRRVKDWIAEIAGSPAASRIARQLADHPQASSLLAGLAEYSPHLFDLVRSDPARFSSLLSSDPDRHFAQLLAETAAQITGTADEAAVMRLLRYMKSEASLLIALADIGGVWPLERITSALTEVADAAVATAVRYLLADAARRGRYAPGDPATPENDSGYFVIAMGKMGAGELNYSSDIDIIVFYEAAGTRLSAGVEPAPFFVRLTQRLVHLIQQRTADGYVFRTDLRLRPDPASTQIAVSIAAALEYYERVGQNWERAALIKARPCAGDLAAGEKLLTDLAPFVWRKYLDFATIAEIHAMKQRIHAFRGHGEIAIEGHNIKVGRGGIREIEFFVQTQQLVAGGRHPELRERKTLKALAALADGGWIDAKARDDLADAYRFLRSLEHRLQMVADEQTHALPPAAGELERFARFFGFSDRAAFAEVLAPHLRNVQRHYAALFEGAPEEEARRLGLRFPPAADDRETLDKLSALGFQKPLEVSAIVRGWLHGEVRSLKNPLARAQLAELVPLLISHFARATNPNAALIAFDRFLIGLRAAGRLISLLRRNPDLLSLLAVVLGTAPRLADHLAQRPELMDAVVDARFFGIRPDAAALEGALEQLLRPAGNDEDFLERIRGFAQEQMFLVGTGILSGTISAQRAGEAYAQLADVLIRLLYQRVARDVAEINGHIRHQQLAILALGKLGGREMTANSDLDLIVVYDFDRDHPESDGPRPLHGAQYFTRLTQRLIGALTAQTNYGVLYQVDLRLRPSGRSGPLVTRLDSFTEYQEREAWTWEHMALTRARVVAGSPEFGAQVKSVVRDVLMLPRDRDATAGDVVSMREAIAREKGDAERWDIKHAAGGLIDVEFIAQYLQLIHAASAPDILDTSTARALDKAARGGLIGAEHAEGLRNAMRLYGNLTQVLRLCLAGPFDPQAASPGLIALLTRAADVPDLPTLDAYLAETRQKVRASFEEIVGGL